MPKDDAAIDEIKTLEERRYRAMIAGDAAALDELCSDDLIYTHSKGDHDDKRSYLHKVGFRYFTYLEITHPADPHCSCRQRRARDRKDDGQGFGSRHDRTGRQSLSCGLGARAWRLDVCCLPANADHRGLTSIEANPNAKRDHGEAPCELTEHLTPCKRL